jgi:hypothetical protein
VLDNLQAGAPVLRPGYCWLPCQYHSSEHLQTLLASFRNDSPIISPVSRVKVINLITHIIAMYYCSSRKATNCYFKISVDGRRCFSGNGGARLVTNAPFGSWRRNCYETSWPLVVLMSWNLNTNVA